MWFAVARAAARVSAGPRAASPAGERGTTRCWQRQRKYLKAGSIEGISAVISRQHYPESITTTVSGYTWLSENYDPVLLYGSLVEAYTFMKGEPDLIAAYEKKYQESLMMAKRLGDGMEKQDQYRSGTPRVPVS